MSLGYYKSWCVSPVIDDGTIYSQSDTGTIGHVAHGKSTVVKAISGVMTVRFKNELVRNITIKLGYANAKVCVSALLRVGALLGYGGGVAYS